MRTTLIAPGEYYHIFNRGNHKQRIYHEEKDWARFLFLLIYLQSPLVQSNISRHVNYFMKSSSFKIPQKEIKQIVEQRSVALVNFSLMPNHFHATVQEIQPRGIATYMQRVLGGFTKYSNTKYEKSGHVFQGPFKTVHITNNTQLLYLSAYIHRNPRELPNWHSKEHEYPWSSYRDYIEENRWNSLLEHDIITQQVSLGKEYKQFVEESGAKDFKEHFESELLQVLDLT